MKLSLGNDGDVLWFPVVQTCVEGSTNWTSTDGNHDSNPAPKLVLMTNGTLETAAKVLSGANTAGISASVLAMSIFGIVSVGIF